jgi:hypothetical protein
LFTFEAGITAPSGGTNGLLCPNRAFVICRQLQRKYSVTASWNDFNGIRIHSPILNVAAWGFAGIGRQKAEAGFSLAYGVMVVIEAVSLGQRT